MFLLAANDVRLTLRDRVSAFWLFLLPIFLMWLFGRVDGRWGGTPQVSLTVVDRDGGWLAESFAKELDGPNVALAVFRGADADGEAAKKATRWIELPAGFTENALAGKQQRLKIETGQGRRLRLFARRGGRRRPRHRAHAGPRRRDEDHRAAP